MIYLDPLYFLLMAPGLLIGIIASILLKVWNSEYSKKENVNHISGTDLVAKVCQKNNINLQLQLTNEELGDNFNPRDMTLTLSKNVAYGTTIGAVAVAAHELGHVLQKNSKSPLILLREMIVPVVNIGTNTGYFLIVIGFVIDFLRLSELGLILFSLSTVFTLITLPIEIDASSKALKILKKEQILFDDEMSGAKKVLIAAALTYVAALFQSIGQILYFFFRIRSKD